MKDNDTPTKADHQTYTRLVQVYISRGLVVDDDGSEHPREPIVCIVTVEGPAED